MCGEEEEREKKKSKQYHPEKKNQQQQYFQVLMRETSSRLPFGHDTHNRIVHESHQEQTSKQMVKQTTTTTTTKMSKCAPRKSSYDSASLQASAVSEKPLFFFNNRIQLATQSDRGKNNRKPDTVCYMERTKKKKADYEITKKKKMAHP